MAVSHTAIFVLGAVAIAGSVGVFNRPPERQAGDIFMLRGLGGIFIGIYFVYLRVMLSSASPMGAFCLQSSSPHFMPSMNPFVRDSFSWFCKSGLDFFAGPVGIKPAALALGMSVLGAAGVWRSDKRAFIMLIGPAVLMLAACGLKKFPFHDRFVLFLVPAAVFLVARGVGMIMARGRSARPWGWAFSLYCVFHRKEYDWAYLCPQGHEETKLLVGFVKHNQLAGDEIYMNNSAQQAYAYYLTYYRFHLMPAKKGYFLDAGQQ